MIYTSYDVDNSRDNISISLSKGAPMTFHFKFADKSRVEEYLPDCFKILRANMEAIAPDGKTYEEAFSEWYCAVYPAMSKDARQMALIFNEDELIGFFMYYVTGGTFMMEEIQIEKKYHQSGVFRLLYTWLLPKLPENTKTVEAYAHKNNLKSQNILEHLGLVYHNKDGDCFHFKGNFEDLENKYQK